MPAAAVTDGPPVLLDHAVRPELNPSEKMAFGRETVTVVFTALLQLPARSMTRRLNRCAPVGIPKRGTVAMMLEPEALKPKATTVPWPTPGSVVPSQNSATAMVVLLIGAVSVSSVAALVGLGDPTAVPRTGPPLSTTRFIVNREPQLPAVS